MSKLVLSDKTQILHTLLSESSMAGTLRKQFTKPNVRGISSVPNPRNRLSFGQKLAEPLPPPGADVIFTSSLKLVP